MSSTGHGLWCSVWPATLPRMLRTIPVRPWEAITTAAAPRSLAVAAICCALAQVAAAMHIEPDRLRQIRLAAGAPASLDVPIGLDSDLARAETVADDAALSALQVVDDSDDLPETRERRSRGASCDARAPRWEASGQARRRSRQPAPTVFEGRLPVDR
jgi:hypothetical protein